MKELLLVLNNIHSLSPSLQQYLNEKLKSRTVHKKEFILEAGHVSRHIYFIRKGLLRCYYMEGGQEVCSKFLKEGDIIVSASSFFLQRESYEYIQALEPSLLYFICYDELQYIYNHFPEFNIISRVITTKSYLLSEQRLTFIRMKSAADRYNLMIKNFPELILRVQAKYIASYLGISVETLSRIRSRRK
ncbi:MAG: Crp/Fnr family transcriptional regulator [Chitinophagaceae bacterium]|nr:Crp/Fnr family transcriptional regulator [Chitinophagaceae bacterium]